MLAIGGHLGGKHKGAEVSQNTKMFSKMPAPYFFQRKSGRYRYGRNEQIAITMERPPAQA